MQRALYGPGGFYTRGERPAAHFRTSVHASQRFAQAVARLVAELDEAHDLGIDPTQLLRGLMENLHAATRAKATFKAKPVS